MVDVADRLIERIDDAHGELQVEVFGVPVRGGSLADSGLPRRPLRALVADEPGLDTARLLDATIPPDEAIDYYGQLHPGAGPAPRTGASVVFGFRIQAFVTRAYVAGIEGAATGTPRVTGIWTSDGREARWPR